MSRNSHNSNSSVLPSTWRATLDSLRAIVTETQALLTEVKAAEANAPPYPLPAWCTPTPVISEAQRQRNVAACVTFFRREREQREAYLRRCEGEGFVDPELRAFHQAKAIAFESHQRKLQRERVEHAEKVVESRQRAAVSGDVRRQFSSFHPPEVPQPQQPERTKAQYSVGYIQRLQQFYDTASISGGSSSSNSSGVISSTASTIVDESHESLVEDHNNHNTSGRKRKRARTEEEEEVDRGWDVVEVGTGKGNEIPIDD